jgi:antirestriction protein ArdC
MKSDTKTDVYQIITDRILALLDAGVNPWRKPWHAAAWKPPQNLLSRRPYRGVNVLLLGLSPYSSPYWVSFKQALQAGGSVKKGEKASLAVFWKLYDKTDKENPSQRERIPVLRYYHVFNVEQCEGVAYPQPEDVPSFPHDPIAEAERIAAGMPQPPTITHTEERRAFYRQETDTVNIPPLARFDKAAEYYSTLFHELTHATGAKDRLARKLGSPFGSIDYGREELIAEMGSAYLCGLAGILDQTEDNSAAYLDGWRAIIKQDRRAVVLAAGAAQKAVDYITNAQPAAVPATEEAAA